MSTKRKNVSQSPPSLTASEDRTEAPACKLAPEERPDDIVAYAMFPPSPERLPVTRAQWEAHKRATAECQPEESSINVGAQQQLPITRAQWEDLQLVAAESQLDGNMNATKPITQPPPSPAIFEEDTEAPTSSFVARQKSDEIVTIFKNPYGPGSWIETRPAPAEHEPAAAEPQQEEESSIDMATQRQIEANRRNARKSTGPVTEAGKQTVSQNATKHGLTAAYPVVLPEEEEQFRLFEAAVWDEWNSYDKWDQMPATERRHVDRLVHCAWRLKRVARIETSVLIDLCKKQENPPGDETTLGRAYTQASATLNTLSRYERQLERSVREAQHELELLVYARCTDDHTFYVRNRKKFPGEQPTKKEDQNHVRHHRSSDEF